MMRSDAARAAARRRVFALTFFSFASLHAVRKIFSTLKAILVRTRPFGNPPLSITETTSYLGLLDSLFLASYAVGLFLNGPLADKYPNRPFLTLCLVSTMIILYMFSLAGSFHLTSPILYATLWAAHGLVQSAGWPLNVAIMGRWFTSNERGMVLGIWSSNACIGNILGAGITMLRANVEETEKFGWEITMALSASLLGISAILVYKYLWSSPAEFENHRIQKEDDSHQSLELFLPAATRSSGTEILGFWKAWCIPGVASYAACYACLKSVNYAMFFWLPFYLTSELGMTDEKADGFSMLYDVGQIAGGFIGGYITDKMGAVRSPVMVLMMILSSLCLGRFQSANVTEMVILLLSTGFLVGGPANLISTAISADLGTHPSIRGNAAAMATVTGIIDGTGSAGAALMQVVVGYVAHCHVEPPGCSKDSSNTTPCRDECHWTPVLRLLLVGTLLAALCLSRVLYNDIRKLLKK